MRATLGHFFYRLCGNALCSQMPGGAGCGQYAKAHFVEPAHDRRDRMLVGIIDRHEDGPTQRQLGRGATLRLGECHSKTVGNTHHLTGRQHFGPE